MLDGYCAKLVLPRTAKEFVQQLRTELETTAAEVDANFPTNTALTINEDGEPVLKRPTARKPPASSMELEAAIQTFLPERSLLDVLWLVNSATRFTRHFGPLSGLDAKLENLEERYCATAFVMGSGMGVTQGARHMRGLVTAQTLSLINRRHITIDKLDAAYRDILDGYHPFELPRCWGSGKTASFDGSLFELSEQNLLADFHFRYRLKGAVAFQVVSDLYIALFTISFRPEYGRPSTSSKLSAKTSRRFSQTPFSPIPRDRAQRSLPSPTCWVSNSCRASGIGKTSTSSGLRRARATSTSTACSRGMPIGISWKRTGRI